MTFQEVLEARKSVRCYIARPVEEEKVCAMLEAAALAPSWKNSQTARSYVVRGEMLQKVREALPPFNQRNSEIVSTFIKGRAGFLPTGEPNNELGDGWGAYDCGLHDMALLLKASELGLSTLVMGIRDAAMLRGILNIPAEEEVTSVIAVGYAEEDTPARPARMEAAARSKWFE